MYLQNHEDGLESDAYDHLFQTKQHQYVVTWLVIPLALRAGAGITSHFRASVGRQSMYYYPSYSFLRAATIYAFHIAQASESVKNWPGRRNRLPHPVCKPLHSKEGGADGFVCRANSSHFLNAGTGFPAKASPRRRLGLSELH